MSRFKNAVVKIVREIPKGQVVSYGQVALYAGIPKAARQVGWILNRFEGDSIKAPTKFGRVFHWQIPWWRVVNNSGRVSIKGSKYSANDQKKLLVGEGVKIKKDLTFDIEKYRFVPSIRHLEEIGLESSYLEVISGKIEYQSRFKRK